MDWIRLGHQVARLGWIGSCKMDQCPTLVWGGHWPMGQCGGGRILLLRLGPIHGNTD